MVTGPYESFVSYIGLSTDTKPTIGIDVGTIFYESDTGRKFVFTGSTWVQK